MEQQLGFRETLFDFSDSDKEQTSSATFSRIHIDQKLCQAHPTHYARDGVHILYGDSQILCTDWPSPVTIISDGPYGVSGFSGDPPTPHKLGEWYEPHIAEWTARSTPLTSLWFWNTEIGWANVHPVLEKYGWVYRGAAVWDKGISHIAGNSNTQSLRRLPTVTELCVLYVKDAVFPIGGNALSMKEWLRYEWERTGLPLYKTNEACGVKNAATRKYFTQCHLWYFPPVEAFVKFSAYANRHGDSGGRPYFSLDGRKSLTGEEWGKMRAKFNLPSGITNVWSTPAIRNGERIKTGNKALHTNQKPLSLLELTIELTSEPEDVVWDPFGGVCTGAVASHKLGRKCYSAEIQKEFYQVGITRLSHYDQ
ncbi:MAG: hypothetical protein KJZ86_26105 [Caldilineaceae bacterium]|nr:hypothetical protein [Caldilineaceae bacterium]HRJ41862.1 site-specific DNA-methyltransferase [Caldilineaceae bacterium]